MNAPTVNGPGVNGPGVNAAAVEGRAAGRPPAELLGTAPRERVIVADEPGEQCLLAIDTALGTCVALGVGDRIFEAASDDARGHTEVIGDLIARVFELAGAEPGDVTGVVAGMGPGPFTGLRVGIAAAQAFAVGRGVPLLPLQGHEAVALAVLEAGAAHPRLRVVQDAKRRELFVTGFDGLDWAGVPVRSSDPALVLRTEHTASPDDVWPERIPAARLIQLAARRLAAARGFEPERALYLRAPDVKPSAAPKRVTP